jgi:hypothetical protein
MRFSTNARHINYSRSCLNSFFMVLYSQIVLPFPPVHQWLCASSFTRARASGRSEETYFGALGAKKSTALRYIRAAPRYRDGVVRNGKVEVFFWVVKAALVTLRACAHVPTKGSSLEETSWPLPGCTTLLRPTLPGLGQSHS